MIWMKAILDVCGLSSCDCVVQIGEAAKVNLFVIYSYLCCPFPVYFVPRNTSVTGCVRRTSFCIYVVFSASHTPQVAKPVVGSISINVIDFVFWPASVFNQKNYSMNSVVLPIDVNLKIPLCVLATCDVSWFNTVRWTGFPRQNPGLAIIRK